MVIGIGNSLLKTFVHVGFAFRISTTQKLRFLQNQPTSILSVLYLRYITSTASQHSFTVSYLINTCGLSPESALLVSKRVHFETSDKPDSVITFFKNHGFTKIQIEKLIKRYPPVLLSDTEKTLLPKLKFLYSKGMSSSGLAKALSTYPDILKQSLNNNIIPCFNFFKSLLCSEDEASAVMKRFPDIFLCDPQSHLVPNVAILREHGVPKSNIVYLLTRQPCAFIVKPDGFRGVVEEVKRMGISPLLVSFVLAISVKRQMSKSTWKRKMNVYRRWGWSEEQFHLAFRKHPMCLMVSENKINAIMDFFVNKMGWEASHIVRFPVFMSLSLEKRIVPRCSVIEVLLLKGLIKRDFSLSRLFAPSEKSFLWRYVTWYEEEASHLLKLYQENLALSK